MASDLPLTVQDLDKLLEDLVQWERVALHLPGMTQPKIDLIKKDNPGTTAMHKSALYNTWLQVYPKGTWDDIIKALEIAKEMTLAEKIKQMLNRTESYSNTNRLIGEIQVDERVPTELRQLHKAFECLRIDVETKFSLTLNNQQVIFYK